MVFSAVAIARDRTRQASLPRSADSGWLLPRRRDDQTVAQWVLEPRSDGNSGWYDFQTWALEPLVLPDKMPEASRLRMNDRYRDQLDDLFKSILALTRETHVKQLERLTLRWPRGWRRSQNLHRRQAKTVGRAAPTVLRAPSRLLRLRSMAPRIPRSIAGAVEDDAPRDCHGPGVAFPGRGARRNDCSLSRRSRSCGSRAGDGYCGGARRQSNSGTG